MVHFLVSASIGRPREEVEIIMNSIRMRGVQVIPLLLDILEVEEERRVRQRLLRLLPELGDAVGKLVVERFDDHRWFVLRNLAMVLGEVGEPALAEHLAPLFDHSDPRVRQEAVASMTKLGGKRAGELLTKALDDDDRATFMMAVHGLGYHGDDAAKARLRKLLDSANFYGQNTRLLQAAAIALGRLEDEESRPRLNRLARRPWCFRKRRALARDAAAWALDRLDGKPARKAPAIGAFADLRPGAGPVRLRSKD
jgi:HEAT repeat protein